MHLNCVASKLESGIFPHQLFGVPSILGLFVKSGEDGVSYVGTVRRSSDLTQFRCQVGCSPNPNQIVGSSLSCPNNQNSARIDTCTVRYAEPSLVHACEVLLYH